MVGVYASESPPVRSVSMNIDTRLAELAATLKRLIESSTYKPAEIARVLSVDRSVVGRWMTGERTPTMKNLMELAELLGVEMAEIWQGEEALPSTPEQRLMVDRMRSMTAEQQQAFLAMAATISTGAK